MIDLTKWELYKDYDFNFIEKTYNTDANYLTEYGNGIVGEDFICIKDVEDNVLSFVLDGTTNTDFIYRLIWKG